jgi:hypothetical protein
MCTLSLEYIVFSFYKFLISSVYGLILDFCNESLYELLWNSRAYEGTK